MRRMTTGLPELDQLLGGGLVEGAVVLLAGGAGVGKSTLVMQALAGFASSSSDAAELALRRSIAAGDEDSRTIHRDYLLSRDGLGPPLAVTTEETLKYIAIRRQRLLASSIDIAAERNVQRMLALMETTQPRAVAVDSIHNMFCKNKGGHPGTPRQIEACSAQLSAYAKSKEIPLWITEYVTRPSNITQQLVYDADVVLELGCAPGMGSSVRRIRVFKNRFGPCDAWKHVELTTSGFVSYTR